MVKRKYSGKEEVPKRPKLSENEAPAVPETVQPEKQDENGDLPGNEVDTNSSFDIKHFRKELASNQGQTVGKSAILFKSLRLYFCYCQNIT